MGLVGGYYREAIRVAPRQFAVSTALVLLLTLLQMALPLALRPFMAEVTQRRSASFIALGLGGFALLLLVTSAVNVAWYLSLDVFGGRYLTHLTADLQERLGRADLSAVPVRGPDRVKHTLFTDVLQVFSVIGLMISMLIGSAAVLVAGTVAAFVYSPGIAVLLLLGIAGGLAISLATRGLIQRASKQVKGAMMVHNGELNQFVDGLLMAQTNDVLPVLTQRSRASIRAFIATSQRVDAKQISAKEAVHDYNTLFSVGLSAALSLLQGDDFVVSFVFYTVLASILMSAAERLQTALQSILAAHASFANVAQVRALPARHGDEPLHGIGTLALEEVSFTFPDADAPVFAPLTASYGPGECVRVRARNGGGKSTLLRLLCGVYRPTGGRVLVDGRPLAACRQEDVNRAVLVAGQDETLLNVTPAEYLQVMCAVTPQRAAQLLKTVGFDSAVEVIERGGANLSFGQRKKLLMAKIMARADEASVVILDEAEAGMDVDTCATFEGLVRTLVAAKKIVFLVSHDDALDVPVTSELRLG